VEARATRLSGRVTIDASFTGAASTVCEYSAKKTPARSVENESWRSIFDSYLKRTPESKKTIHKRKEGRERKSKGR
jgi:hypothetical protein